MISSRISDNELQKKLSDFASTDAAILITGPAEAPKESYASYIHQHSGRGTAPFIPVSCSAISDGLLEERLFGRATKVYTGEKAPAHSQVAAAEGGTLFLDGIDELSKPRQVNLLRFLREKRYRPLGEPHSRSANVRFIGAIHGDPLESVKSGRLREDLYSHLSATSVEVPSPPKKLDDLDSLIEESVQRFAKLYGLPPVKFSEVALARLHAYSWPGGIWEVKNCIEYLTCLRLDHQVELEDLPLFSVEEEKSANTSSTETRELSFRRTMRDLFDVLEYLENLLRENARNIAEAACASGKARRAFFELMREHGARALNFKKSKY